MSPQRKPSGCPSLRSAGPSGRGQFVAVRGGQASAPAGPPATGMQGSPLSRPGAAMGDRRYLHEHGPQLQKVVVLRVLHLHDAPRVEAASDLLAFGFNQLIGSNHRERDASLGGDTWGRLAPHGDPRSGEHRGVSRQRVHCRQPQGPLQNPRHTFHLQVAAVSPGDRCTELTFRRFLSLR